MRASRRVLRRISSIAAALDCFFLESSDNLDDWLRKVNKRTLDKNIKGLDVADLEIQEYLNAARFARNELVHEIPLGLDGCIDHLPRPLVESKMKRLAELAVDLAAGDFMIESIVNHLTNEPRYVDSLNGYSSKIREWVTEG